MFPLDVPPPNPVEEMGPLLWVAIIVAVLVIAALAWAIIRRRSR